MDLYQYAPIFVLNTFSNDENITIVLRALESGFDTPSLWQLASLDNPDSETVKRLFCNTFDELGVPLPSPPEAGRSMGRLIAQDVIKKALTA